MAQGRIIAKSISLSEKANIISDSASLLYTWMIPHSDDFGLLQGSALTIKALVAPMRSWTTDQVAAFLKEMIDVGLIRVIHHNGREYFQILNSKQSLRKDRQPQTILSVVFSSDAKESWKSIELQLEELSTSDGHLPVNDCQVTGTDIPMTAEVKGSEGNINTSGSSPLGDVLSSLDFRVGESEAKTVWAVEAERFAKDLGINFDESPEYKGSWFKCFKLTASGTNRGNLYQAYSYLMDRPGELSTEEKILMFFQIWNNGLEERG